MAYRDVLTNWINFDGALVDRLDGLRQFFLPFVFDVQHRDAPLHQRVEHVTEAYVKYFRLGGALLESEIGPAIPKMFETC